MYQAILFDLDGTLTDPGEGITNSVAYALKKFGISVSDRTSLYKFIGPPLHESFEVFYGFDHAKAMQAVDGYREYYRDRGIWENVVYPGIPALLEQLQKRGCRILLATSKPEVFARQILEHFGLAPYFDVIAGSNLDGSRTKKAEVIAYALAQADLEPGTRAVMVGDREHDVLGAIENSLPAIGVLFGYGDQAELERAGAIATAADVAQLSALLLE
jgi:phosphoglycolate phosphatase